MTTEIQPYSSFQELNVPKQKTTNLKLSGGESIPYIYSLGVNSTVPYVQLLGSRGGQKLFTWGEQIIVPPREFVTVKNASYHPGDIFIQSGWDPAAKPERVTVPVKLLLDNSNPDEAFWFLYPEHGVDTRRCRRAYVAGFTQVGILLGVEWHWDAMGIAHQRSHVTDPTFSFEGGNARARYTTRITIPPNTSMPLMPLGERAQFGDTIHSLLDEATFAWSYLNDSTQSGAVHYVLEYL